MPFDAIKETTNRFEVYITAAGSRYMCIIDELLAFIVIRRRKIRIVPSQLFTESDLFSKVNERVEHNTTSDSLACGQVIKKGWHSSPATSWFRRDDFIRGAQVKEWSLFSQNFDMPLSLIWIDEELDCIDSN